MQSTTKYYSVLQSTRPFYKARLPTQSINRSLTLCRATFGIQITMEELQHPCLIVATRDTRNVSYIARSNLWDASTIELRHSCFIVATHETSFTLRGATRVTLQPHQILRLPRKMILMIDPRHIWNVIYIARSSRCHPPTSPNILILVTYETSLTLSGVTGVTSNLTKYCTCHKKTRPHSGPKEWCPNA